jgi:hypothetical protein
MKVKNVLLLCGVIFCTGNVFSKELIFWEDIIKSLSGSNKINISEIESYRQEFLIKMMRDCHFNTVEEARAIPLEILLACFDNSMEKQVSEAPTPDKVLSILLSGYQYRYELQKFIKIAGIEDRKNEPC